MTNEDLAIALHDAYWGNRRSTGEPFDWIKDCTEPERENWRLVAQVAMPASAEDELTTAEATRLYNEATPKPYTEADVERIVRAVVDRPSAPGVDVRRLLADACVGVVCAETIEDMTAALKAQGIEARSKAREES